MNQYFDSGIPVLTDIVETPAAAPAPATAPEVAAPVETLETRARIEWQEQDWQLLERRLSERILHQLQGRVDFVLEQRIKDGMAEVMQHALAGLTAEIGKGLQQTIEKIVSRAITQELTHLQTHSTIDSAQQTPSPWQP